MVIYPENFESKIGFDRIRQMLSEICLCQAGKTLVEEMKFSAGFGDIQYQLAITNEMKQLLLFEDNFPQENYIDARYILDKLHTEGLYPQVEELVLLQKSLNTIRLLKNYFDNDNFKVKYPELCKLASGVKIFKFVNEEINRIVDKYGRVKDNASPELKQVRSDIKSKQASVNQRIQKVLQAAKSSGFIDDDAEVTIRNGRPVIPVQANFKRKLGGIIHDESATGKTSFIEPAEIVEITNAIKELEYAERREIIKILTQFANDIRPYIPELSKSYQYLGTIDFLRAKAKLALKLNANKPILSNEKTINWKDAFHPLLYLSHKANNQEVIPLSLTLTGQEHILVISGPNAGGKSVCLKTIGLLQYMLQNGLLVPASENSETGLFSKIFIDIGDEQSIDNDLSTYSSHLSNMKFFTQNANAETLFLIDEFGTGTEPALGGAIAEAILENLIDKHSFGVVTTHYANLKHYASEHPGIVNGAMMFDTDKIQPLYKLALGRPGSSFAIDIARKIGLSENILKRAQESVGEDHINFDKHLREIIRDKKYWETKRQKIRKVEKKLDELYSKYGGELEQINSERKAIIKQAKEEAKSIISQANTKVENTIRTIKEAQAEKEKTLAARNSLEEYQKQIATEKDNKNFDKKLNELKHAEKRLLQHNKDIRPKQEESKKKEEPLELKPGSEIQLEGMNGTGEVLKIEGNKVTVAFGHMQTTVSKDKLKVTANKSTKKVKSTIVISGAVSKRKMDFKSEIDVRGKRADEALITIQQYIDDAIMVSCNEVRILHGKGNGVLRQLIRDYIKTVDVVKSVRDEHADRGGSGITIVEFNYY